MVSVEELVKLGFDSNIEVNTLSTGHVNKSYILGKDQYLFQKINTEVFKDPELLDNNTKGILNCLKASKDFSSLYAIPELLKTASIGQCHYRVFSFIKNTKTFETDLCAASAESAGECLAIFHSSLKDLKLKPVIPDFLNIAKRFTSLEESKITDSLDRGNKSETIKLYETFKSYKPEIEKLTVDIASNKIPLFTIHADTKPNNFLFNANNTVKAIVDLDTCMTGSRLFDFGYFLRLAALKGKEDVIDSNSMYNVGAYKAFVDGYNKKNVFALTDTEKLWLPKMAWVTILIDGVRFLTDFISGDKYFQINYPEHNLERAKNATILMKACENFAKS